MPQGIVQPVERVAIEDGTPPSVAQALVVKVTVLLASETLPAASRATTFRVYGLSQASPVSVVDVPLVTDV